MQEQLYFFCGITPVDFWDFTPAETELMTLTASKKYEHEYEYQSYMDARLCAVILNANGAKKQNKKPFEVEDFLPQKKTNKKELTIEQHKEIMKAAVLKMGGTVVDI